MAFLVVNQLFAEGTREVAPNGSIDVMGNPTTDIAALHINNPSYNNFAAFDNPDPLSRLYIHVKDPSTECIYLGFNWAHDNVTSPAPPRINFQYRIKDPNGNVVYGPITVTPTDANILTWSEGFTGPMQLHGAGGYNATQVTSINLGSQGWTGKGDYYIEFRDDANNDLLIDFWDITVADCTGPNPVEKTGRLWSYNWSIFAINDFGFPNRPFNGAFYVCAPDPDNISASFITKIDFDQSGFRPAAFNVAFNSFGIQNTGNVSVDRRSVENTNGTIAEYSIFLNDPIDICETAEAGEITILGVSRCDGEDYCIKFIATKAGQIDLLLDFDGPDSMYTPGTADVMISRTVTASEVGKPTCIEWDGKDGLGNPLPENLNTQIPIIIAFAQGIYHFPIYDAEYMTDGFMISAVRPAASVSLLFYDDSNISVPSGSGEPASQLSGCMPPCHRWTNYTMPNTPGFGNLNTINSWWFSQLIIRQDVFFLPTYYTCNVEGPASFCSGGTAELDLMVVVYPLGADGLEMISTVWSGPGIVGDNTGSSIIVNDGGVYELELTWINSVGDTCTTSCTHEIAMDPPASSSIDTLIVQGESVVINGETYTEAGEYSQLLTTSEGCDSILNITVIVLSTIIHYDLNDCESFMGNGTHMDYSEFIPSYPDPLACATIIADTLRRDNPQVNKHSCTPGIDGSPGMCVGALQSCTYAPGHEASVIIEVLITPDPDTAVYLTGFSFYEKAPNLFDWISGISGLNNYPTLFGIRILKNGIEIFSVPATPTSLVWNENVYDFLGNEDFLVKDPTTFRFELLSYCPVGNAGGESVWDLDKISIIASCSSLDGFNQDIAGVVTTRTGGSVPNVEMQLFDDVNDKHLQSTNSKADGHYLFESVVPEHSYYIRGYKNTDHLNGVSTLDLIHIQKHLLGIKLLESPYQMIAADANRSNSISAIDLLELRKLLLGIYNELPKNTSWRFGAANQHLDTDYPWVFDETYNIEYLVNDIANANFIGVKIGDVNGDVNPKLTAGSIKPRSNESLAFQFDNIQMKAGEEVSVDIKAGQLAQIAGMQMQLSIQSGHILDLKPGAINLTDDQFYITPAGEVNISWVADDMLIVQPNLVLFTIVMMSDEATYVGDVLSMVNEKLSPEVYLGEGYEVVTIEFEAKHTQSNAAQNAILDISPNPFSQNTTIRFELADESTVTFTYFDLSGRQLFAQKGEFSKGQQRIELKADDLKSSTGMIICRMQTNDFIATRKLMVNY